MPSRVALWIKDLLSENTQIPLSERKGRKGFEGKQTGLPSNRWLAAMFECNEFRCLERILDTSKIPLTNSQILFNYRQEFVLHRKEVKFKNGTIKPGGAIESGKHGIGMMRGRYREGSLYSGQSVSFLFSFRYSPGGHICRDRTENKFLTFREAQELCIKFQIADPRFFSPEDMERIHKHAVKSGTYHQWTIPTRDELKELQDLIPVELYRSLKTYDIWKKEIPPSDWSPPNPIQDEKEQQQIENSQRQAKKVQKQTEKGFNPADHF